MTGENDMREPSDHADQGPCRGAWALTAFFAIAPAAAVGGGLLLAPLQALAALLGWPLHRRKSWIRAFAWPAAIFAVFAAYIAVTLLWSVEPRWDSAVKIAALLLGGLVFVAAASAASRQGRALITAAGAAACVSLIILIGIEALADMPLNRMAQPDAETGALARNPGKGVSFLIVLVWGVVAAYGALKGWRSSLAMLCLAAAAVLSPQFDMNANMIALAAGGVVFLAARLAPAFVLGLTVGGLALWMVSAPFLVTLLTQVPSLTERLPLSWQQRVEIWRFAESRIMEKPILGWGLDGARSFRGQYSQVGDLQFPSIPLHPHSVSLHVWLELGAIGAVLAAGAILAVGAAATKALHHDPHRMATAAAAMATIGVVWNVSYGAWQEWWMITPFVAAALIVAGGGTATQPAGSA